MLRFKEVTRLVAYHRFTDLDHLTHLNISGMSQLHEIDTGTFAGLKSLEVLMCSHNRQLQEFDMSDLKGLIRLRQVTSRLPRNDV